MNKKLEYAYCAVSCFRLGTLSAAEFENELLDRGFYNITFEFPATAAYLGITYTLEQ